MQEDHCKEQADERAAGDHIDELDRAHRHVGPLEHALELRPEPGAREHFLRGREQRCEQGRAALLLLRAPARRFAEVRRETPLEPAARRGREGKADGEEHDQANAERDRQRTEWGVQDRARQQARGRRPRRGAARELERLRRGRAVGRHCQRGVLAGAERGGVVQLPGAPERRSDRGVRAAKLTRCVRADVAPARRAGEVAQRAGRELRALDADHVHRHAGGPGRVGGSHRRGTAARVVPVGQEHQRAAGALLAREHVRGEGGAVPECRAGPGCRRGGRAAHCRRRPRRERSRRAGRPGAPSRRRRSGRRAAWRPRTPGRRRRRRRAAGRPSTGSGRSRGRRSSSRRGSWPGGPRPAARPRAVSAAGTPACR